jgi:hypothetical protein
MAGARHEVFSMSNRCPQRRGFAVLGTSVGAQGHVRGSTYPLRCQLSSRPRQSDYCFAGRGGCIIDCSKRT